MRVVESKLRLGILAGFSGISLGHHVGKLVGESVAVLT